jgi:predicted nucleotidyltransferase
MRLDLRDEHLAVLRSCLRLHLPAGARAFAFGSRVDGAARRYADLDVALVWDRPLDLDTMAALAEALSESDLPFKVDLLDAALIDPVFRARIADGWVPLLEPGVTLMVPPAREA